MRNQPLKSVSTVETVKWELYWTPLQLGSAFLAQVRSSVDLVYPEITKVYISKGLIITSTTSLVSTPYQLCSMLSSKEKLDRSCHVVLADGGADAFTQTHTERVLVNNKCVHSTRSISVITTHSNSSYCGLLLVSLSFKSQAQRGMTTLTASFITTWER